jgi:type II restriction enzyme
MATSKQQLGAKGEKAVREQVSCPRCGRSRHLAPLRANFPCADLICKFCGFLAQVKTYNLKTPSDALPRRIPGAGWRVQHEQIMAGIYHGLYLVGYRDSRLVRIDYVPAHILQASPDVFEPRKALSPKAKRAGWIGFEYNIEQLPAIGIENKYLRR